MQHQSTFSFSQPITNKNNLCNNCGKQGHLFHQCKLPITSCGIILFRKRTKDSSKNESKNESEKDSEKDSDSEYEYLMIRRKDSFGYIGFLRGKYIQHNAEQLQNMFDEMSIGEKENIRFRSFDILWKQMWGETYIGSQYKSEELISQKKFDVLKNGINITDNDSEFVSEVNQFRVKKMDLEPNLEPGPKLEPKLEPNQVKSQFISLETLVNNSSTNWKETEWEFPKGRRNYQEKDLDCAIREFEEETGISKHNISIIENIMPFEEIFVGSNHKAYKHKYFLAFMNDEEDETENKEKDKIQGSRFNNSKYSLSNFQKTEVSKIKWKSLTSCLESIRPYNLEKKHLILNINNILNEYSIF